jgi:hypothetical protein
MLFNHSNIVEGISLHLNWALCNTLVQADAMGTHQMLAPNPLSSGKPRLIYWAHTLGIDLSQHNRSAVYYYKKIERNTDVNNN